jgi:division/cell wall cluster transcriptional repressor MraZ
MAESTTNMPMFNGRFRHGIDSSRRVMIPAKWRPKNVKVEFTVLLWPIRNPQFLLVLPPERWQVMLDKLKAKSLTDNKAASVERFIGENSAPLELDRVGRFCLPQDLADAVGLKDEAQFVGRVDKFEIWGPTAYDTQKEQDRAAAADAAEEYDL